MSTINKAYHVQDPDTLEHKLIWDSRSSSVVNVVFVKDVSSNEWYVLVNKRGIGCPDYVGYWVCPCGYLDWDEDEYDAAIRETFEETGFTLNRNDIKKYGFTADPKQNRQNISFRMFAKHSVASIKVLESCLTMEHCEPDEIEDIRFIRVNDIDIYGFAFGHKELIKEIYHNRIVLPWWKRIILKLYNKYLGA